MFQSRSQRKPEDNSLVDENCISTFGGDIRQFLNLWNTLAQHASSRISTYKSAGSTTNEDQESRQVWSAVWQGIAGIVGNGGVIGYHVEGQCVREGQGKSLEVGDGVMLDTIDCGILDVIDGTECVIFST